jgi:APA family basic amino acid/polyamine antiporter
LDSNLLKTKSIEALVDDIEKGKHLKRTLTALDLTLLGIGAIIGTGIFVLTGTAAANQAGPAITLSYVLAGLACGFAALCYAEFAAMIPIAGSAYAYAYATLGEIIAWMIGWDLILEYAVGSMTVSIGWSGYMQRLLAGFGWNLPVWMSAAPGTMEGAVVNLPAVFIVLAITALLVIGIRESARFNATMVAIKLVAVVFFIGAGFKFVKPENWSPFAPYGWSGIMAAGAVVFFAYIGFDAVSTTAEEAKNPSRDLPIGIIASLFICTFLYIVVSGILAGIMPVTHYRTNPAGLPGTPIVASDQSTAFLNAPVAYALHVIDQDWAAGLISAGAAAGITSVLLVMLMGQPRIFFSMSRDRLLPPGVSKVHPRFGTPYITTIITGLVVAFFAAIIPINVVGEMTSIGTLFAFVVVCSAVMMLRVKRPEARRPFRVPFGFLFPICGVLSCLYLMLSLSVATWVRFLVWLDIGMMIYWFYGRRHSPLADKAEQAAQSGREKTGNFVTLLGALALFNGFFTAVLAAMTLSGLTSEALANWREIHVAPHQAAVAGVAALVVGAVVLAAGRMVARQQPAAAA